MEELFNRSILDQLYDSISDDFETMLLKKKNSDGKFTESLKVEEELIYLIKKLVKDEEILDQITNKLNKQALKDREDYQILNKKISELKYKYPNVRTFLEEKEPIDLRNDEQYAMLNVLDYETEQAEQVDSKTNNLDNLSSLGKLLSKNFGQIQPNKNLKVI